jgi:hypothetical protein
MKKTKGRAKTKPKRPTKKMHGVPPLE